MILSLSNLYEEGHEVAQLVQANEATSVLIEQAENVFKIVIESAIGEQE